jgi:LmbE family N-acetylglucosaminyl deacetylase
VALAIAAHPDDIEFGMAGTLLRLAAAGWETHYLTVADGSCGSIQFSAARTRAIRRREARRAARILGAHFHESLVPDLEILYTLDLLRRVAAVVRQVQPTILLTHSPQDYMEDHVNTSRLAVSAAFARGMPNFRTVPTRAATGGEVTIYHAMPHGLCDALGRRVLPGAYVNTTAVHRLKRAALAAHASQKTWLDVSQGMDSYLRAMDQCSRTVGRMSAQFKHAEGWRRHAHLGFCAANADPLRAALGKDYALERRYARLLKTPTPE